MKKLPVNSTKWKGIGSTQSYEKYFFIAGDSTGLPEGLCFPTPVLIKTNGMTFYFYHYAKRSYEPSKKSAINFLEFST